MRRVSFVKSSPSGNVTILVRDASLTPMERAASAAELMRPDHVVAEQAGFVNLLAVPPRLDMMGGEFCMNATRSFAALLFGDGLLEAGPEDWFCGIVSVSGMDGPLRVRVRGTAELCESHALIDLPKRPPVRRVAEGICEVRVPGIVHLVLDAAVHPLPTDWERETAALFARFDLLKEEAAGCIWLERKERPGEENGLALTPFVHVRETGTTCAETACGSGSLAAATVIWEETGMETPLSILQPGGDPLTVSPDVSRFAGGWAVWVGGSVLTVARGEAFVRCLGPIREEKNGAGELHPTESNEGPENSF